MKKAFTLLELLIVIAILTLLMSLLMPSISRARDKAKITVVNAELNQIGLCLEMYMSDNNGKAPATRTDCNYQWQDHQLPPELVTSGYLSAPKSGTIMSTGMEDRFNRGSSYKYWAVGELYQNGRYMSPKRNSILCVPLGFPSNDGSPRTDVMHKDPAKSPVTWAIFSQGPNYNSEKMLNELNGPVPKRTWYDPAIKSGLITRIRLKNGAHIGTFEGRAKNKD